MPDTGMEVKNRPRSPRQATTSAARKIEVSFGQRVAEDEVDELASYFVQTEQWRLVESGQVDIVFGSKGAGKSAIYSTLLSRADEMFDQGILLMSRVVNAFTVGVRDNGVCLLLRRLCCVPVMSRS